MSIFFVNKCAQTCVCAFFLVTLRPILIISNIVNISLMKTLKLIKSDTYLRPYAEAIEGRYNYALKREKELTGGKKLSEWANGYMYFGLHKVDKQWVLREWAPNATAIYMIGDFNNWQKDEAYRLQPVGNGVWEVVLDEDMIRHEQLYKLLVEWGILSRLAA
jgi:1,4-alpha-glucan branching enzyme